MDDSLIETAPERDPDMPDDALGLGLAPVAPPLASATPYRVLARKYRPQNFAELIGQDAMVQTLGNAIKRDRLAHAFLMTGVRGGENLDGPSDCKGAELHRSRRAGRADNRPLWQM
jgi:DNA polymerase-3 subunit gamma/tau